MMGHSSTSVAPRRRARVLSHLSVRLYLTAGGAVASAGILVLSTVAAPPDLHDARTEVRAVHLTGFAVPPAETWVGILEKLSSNQARTGVLVSPVGGAADVTNAVITTRTAGVTKSLESDPAPTLNKVDAVALAATPTADLGAILGPLLNNSVVGPVVLFGAIFLGFFVILPVEWFIETVYEAFAGVLGLPPTLPLPGTVGALPGAVTATAYANTIPALKLMSDLPLTDSEPVAIANVEPPDAAPATEIGKVDIAPPLTLTNTPTETKQNAPTELATGNDQMSEGTANSTGKVTEDAAPDEASTDPTAANVPEPSADDSAPEPAKPAARPRPGKHGSLGLGKLRDLLRHGDAGRPTIRSAAADAEKASARPSSVASSGDNSPGGDGDDS